MKVTTKNLGLLLLGIVLIIQGLRDLFHLVHWTLLPTINVLVLVAGALIVWGIVTGKDT